MANSVIQFRIDEDLKREATEIYEALGLDLSSALRMFLKRTVAVGGIPFSMILPDDHAAARKAMRVMSAMQTAAEKNGTADMSLEEINAEISAVRQARRETDGKA